ncbi:hypothetical protein [Bacillus tequilensis]|uniref:Uncharacterized protein n=1 Tax=Bacillus tequilensis TaxID=227866 RepID=A0A6H0WIA6_9BACI|nr:hypothetical protein [Bacillus tequilensis]QIW80270.1 hypothetical protein G4P54_10945 [Bacillus tequilensis]
MPGRKLEKRENYKVTTEITDEVQEWVDEVIGSKEFYDFSAPIFHKYLSKKEKELIIEEGFDTKKTSHTKTPGTPII